MTGPVVDGVELGRVWVSVAARVWQRRPGPVERLATRLLRSPGLARALVTTPSLVLGWVIASVVVLAVGAAATVGTGTPVVALVAPVVAGAGIAYAYGPGVDPAWELAASMAVSDRLVLLARASVVFAVNAGLGLAASVASGAAATVTFGWLVPMTAVCAVSLAVATVSRSAAIGAAVGLSGWGITVLGGQVLVGQWSAAVTRQTMLAPYVAVAVVAVVVVLRATRNERGTV